ncbi:MAG TPA: FtsX-like permease family protein, partial [Candidatus Sulfotelmatobacter sp.]|nr:FtsX-like permease family protein [Candidatus Sulfotelmatobacter sp.]
MGLGAAYLSHLFSRARPTSRAGRYSRKAVSFSPFIAGFAALFLWFGALSSVVGGSTINLEIYIVIVLLLISMGMILRDRLTFRMALRNFVRRKTSMAIVILGLMIGTAMISGSLVTQDTFTELFTRGAYYGYGFADEVVYAFNVTGAGYQYFPASISQSLSSQLARNPQASQFLLGSTPEILDTVSLSDSNSGNVQSPATLIGTFSNASQTLGDFHSSDGSVITSSIRDTEAVINDKTARDLNASIGDSITVYSSLRATFKLVGIAVSDARGSFSGNDNVFVTLNEARQLTNHPGSVNYIAITNTGGLRDSIQHSQVVGLAANQTLNSITNPPAAYKCKTDPSQAAGPTATLCAYSEKQAAVNSATTSAQSLSSFLIVLSTFVIVAGIVLIVNIFVMLAEERKSEMGMSRAVGMRRGQLTKMFLFEGSLYSAGAAFVGVFVGIAIAYVIVYVFATIIARFFPVNLSQVLASFTFTPGSLFTAFTEGLLITYVTILFTSWRVSKLNIIRAIRNIPEPPRGVRTYTVLSIAGIVAIILGAFVFEASYSAKSAVEALVGPSIVIFGAGLILSRFLRNRYAFTITGIALLIQWGVPSLSWNNPLIQKYNFGVEIYFAGGILMVLGGILVVMYNTDVALKILHGFYRRRKTLIPIFRTALAYPESKRFRTAATVAMFSLVLFTVAAIASLTAEQNAALDNLVKTDSGGYDIITESSVPVPNFASMVQNNTALQNKVATVIDFNNTVLLSANDATSGQYFTYPVLLGADQDAPPAANFFLSNTFQVVNMTAQYKTPSEVWSAVMHNSSNVVWSYGAVSNRGPPTSIPTPNVGDVLVLTGSLGAGTTPVHKSVTVVALVNGVFLNGIVGTKTLLMNPFKIGTGGVSFIKVASGADPTSVAGLLRKEFLNLKMQTVVIPVVLSAFLQIGQSFEGLLEGFLGLGLVVGIAGLGIISIRSVAERRQEIGILRALGFRRRMILAVFVLENSYISLLGILIGILLGIDVGYA